MENPNCLQCKMKMQVSPSVRVSIINWNGSKYIEKCIESLIHQTYDNYEIVVMDNASTDGSSEIVKRRFPNVQIVELDRNYGFARAANISLRNCGKSYGIVMNNDAWVQKNFIESLVGVAESDPRIASVACKVVRPTDGTIDHSYVPVFTDRRKFMNKAPYLIDEPDDRQYQHQCRVLSNCACAVLYRIIALMKIGFYDETMFSNFEDHDAGYRLNLAGYICIYTPDTAVIHVGGASEGSHSSPKRLKLIVRNILYSYLKDYESRELLTVVPQLIVALAGRSILYWREDRSQSMPFPWILSYVLGLKELLSMMPNLIRARRLVQDMRVVPDRTIFQETSINQFSFYRK